MRGRGEGEGQEGKVKGKEGRVGYFRTVQPASPRE